MNAFDLPQLTVRGSAAAMGRQYGMHFRALIGAFVDNRMAAVAAYLDERGHDGIEALLRARSEIKLSGASGLA